MDELRPRFGLSYERTTGLLQLFRTPRDVALAKTTIAYLTDAGIAHRQLSPAECRLQEPGLSDIAFEGGLHLTDAEAGNCPLFARQLRDAVRRARRALPVRHHGRRRARRRRRHRRADARPGRTRRAARGRGRDRRRAPRARRCCDASRGRLPLYPVKGYSASVAIREPTYAPLASLMDEAYKVAIVRLGNRIRVAGTAELGEPDPVARLDERDAGVRDAAEGRARLVPRRGRISDRELVGRRAADAARRTAGARRDAPSARLRQRRPRVDRMDDGGRLGSRRGRRDHGPDARDRPRRADARALWLIDRRRSTRGCCASPPSARSKPRCSRASRKVA